ncbi:MAG: murein biosynthesis integral membrane protein MurJ [Acidimicrobiaceae bacterium]|nr:murein biosynthesis integral membrane protein MurJ [Ilumatobacteraceae bacterium]NQW67966.1 murein biosynthesis integral membrane protein MurJ [Acidimicrobiaceae bacterium]
MVKRSLLASNLGVASGTLASRITGLARLVIFAAIIGQTALADAFDVGNNAPNVIYELLLGGTLTATLVPLFVGHRERNDRSGTAAVFGTGLVTLALITVLAIAAAPLIFRLYALSPTGDAELFHTVGTALTQVFLIQIFFYGVNALAAAILHAQGRFLIAAWAPVASNLVAIAALLALRTDTAILEVDLANAAAGTRLFWWFTLGPTVGIAAMAALVLIAAIRTGALPRPHFAPRHPAVRELARLSGWTIGYIAANQMALVVVKNLAEPGSGQLDAYAKAMMIFQLPHGLLAVTIVTTAAPLLARAAAQGNQTEFQNQFARGARMTVTLTLLPSIALAIFARPIVQILLGWGEFSDTAVASTAQALSGLAIGLVGFSLYLFTLRGFYSHGDTRTPFVINVIQNVLNVLLAFVLVPPYGVQGLGLAFAISYLVSAVVAVEVLRRKHGTAGLNGLISKRSYQ